MGAPPRRSADEGLAEAGDFKALAVNLFHENWRLEQRTDGLYVIIEEIGGLGALGPFADADAARIGFARYFLGLDPAPPSGPILPKNDAGKDVVP